MVPKPQPAPPVDVCVITTIHYAYDERIYARELMALVDAGYSTALVSPWVKTSQADPRVTWIQLAAPSRRLDRVLHGWRTFRAALKVRARAYHFHDLDFLPWSLLLKWWSGTPVVYDCHENYPEEILHNKAWIPAVLRRPLAFCVRHFETFGARLLGHVIVPVPSLREKFTKSGTKHVDQVRNLARWKARRELGHGRAMIFTGGLLPSYGVDGLLEISRELKRRGRNYPLILTDRFPSQEARAAFMRVIDGEGLPVEVLPKVPPGEMDQLLSKASIGLATEMDTPDRRLSLPTKLFEYMALGLPVVASGIPHSREVVEAAGSGIVVEPGDWKAFSDAIESLWEDQDLFRGCRDSGFDAIEGSFSWDLEQRKVVSFFAEILGPASPVSAHAEGGG